MDVIVIKQPRKARLYTDEDVFQDHKRYFARLQPQVDRISDKHQRNLTLLHVMVVDDVTTVSRQTPACYRYRPIYSQPPTLDLQHPAEIMAAYSIALPRNTSATHDDLLVT
jgi:hypothetical protein